MKIYGLLGFTHGWAHILTVMSPEGSRAALEHMTRTDDLIVTADPSRLTHYLEKRNGALQRLIDTYDVQVLSKKEWDAQKQSLGEKIWK